MTVMRDPPWVRWRLRSAPGSVEPLIYPGFRGVEMLESVGVSGFGDVHLSA
jgi:hypothetical protein